MFKETWHRYGAVISQPLCLSSLDVGVFVYYMCALPGTFMSAVKHYFLAALGSLKPNCVNHGLCVGDIKPPSTSPVSPAALYTLWTHTNIHKSLKGTFTVDPSFTRLTIGDQLSTAVPLYWKYESLFNIFTGSRHLLVHACWLQHYILLLTCILGRPNTSFVPRGFQGRK